MNAQAFNRYSYVANSPLVLTDPSGYSWFSDFFHSIGTFFTHAFGGILRSIPILGNILQIAASVLICGPGFSVCAVAVAAASSAFVAGVTSGNLGMALKAGLIAAATVVAFNGVGNATAAIGNDAGPFAAQAFNVAGHALVGCGSAVAAGDKCGPSALAGAVTSAAGPFINGLQFPAALAANTVLGGLAAVAGGGKFANGAMTGAFGYLFNHVGHMLVGTDADYQLRTYLQQRDGTEGCRRGVGWK
jgi:hypothetical protein